MERLKAFGADMQPTENEAKQIEALGFIDQSWGNDACISYERHEGTASCSDCGAIHHETDTGITCQTCHRGTVKFDGTHLKLWVDAINPNDRESDYPRFNLIELDDDGEQIESLYSGDDLNEALGAIK